jgi:L-aspartate oxidase
MTATATLIAAAALAREESRGGHWRDDFPAPNPALAQRTLIQLPDAMAIREAVLKEHR